MCSVLWFDSIIASSQLHFRAFTKPVTGVQAPNQSRFQKTKNGILCSWQGPNSIWIPPNRIHNAHETLSKKSYIKNPPSHNDILRWEQSFLNTGRLAYRGGNSRPRIREVTTESLQELFQNDPKISLRAASARLSIPTSAIHSILRKCFLFPYKLRNVMELLEVDKGKWFYFPEHCQNHPDVYTDSLSESFSLMNVFFVSMIQRICKT